jgi:hypothetical protein
MKKPFLFEAVLLFLLSFASTAFSLVSETQKGVAVYDFIEGYEDYDVDSDGSTLILGDWFDESKAVFRFYLPPEFGSHQIDYLKITVNGTGTIDNIRFGGPTAVNYTNIANTATFEFPDPGHPSISISDLLESNSDSLGGKRLRIQIDVTASGSYYALQNITIQYNHVGVSDQRVENFMEAYTAYLNIKSSSEMIYARWEQGAYTSQLMFWLGWTRALGTMLMGAFNEVVGGLVSWGIGNIPWCDWANVVEIAADWIWFDSSHGRDCKEDINSKCIAAYQDCESLASLWKQSFDTPDPTAIVNKISDLDTKLTNLQTSVNTAVSGGLHPLYDIYKERWISGNGNPGSSLKGDLMAEVMIRSFAPLIAYDFSETQAPVVRNDSFINTLKQTLLEQKNEFNEVTILAYPSGKSLKVKVDSVEYTESQFFYWTDGSSHTIEAPSPQTGSDGKNYVFQSWSDGGARVHTITPTFDTTITAVYSTSESVSLNASEDAYVSDQYPTTNFGQNYLIVLQYNLNYIQNCGLLKFDLISIPNGSTVDYVELNLTLNLYSGTQNNVYIHKVTQSWNENSVTWNTKPSYDTDIIAGPTDFGNSPVWSWNSNSYPKLKTVVQNWVNNASQNYGLYLQDELRNGAFAVIFYSRHNTDDKKPKIIVNYTPPPPDVTPPTPNPMTWATQPYATSPSSITMVATTANDPSGVEYYFDETSGNPGGSDSGWQSSTTYTDTGLLAGTSYTYKVKARDKSPNHNETSWSSSKSATTPLAAPSSISYPSSSNTGEYSVSWSSSSGATSYQLERSDDSGSSWSQVYSGSSTSYSEYVGNGSHRYRVKATNAGGSSGWTTGAWDCVVAYPYGGGNGTADDPYLINTPQQLNFLGMSRIDWNKCFKLMADLDLSCYTGTQFNRIGTNDDPPSYPAPFTGTFDGNNHIISNFTYTAPTAGNVGLFGCVGSGGQIKNLGLINVNVTGYYYTGGLVGWNDGTITNCYATGSVTGQYETGGLVGYNWGTVTNSYADGTVSGSYHTGGLVGLNFGAITNSYAAGSVTGSSYTGGLVGYGGGVVNSFWDIETTGQSTSAGGKGRTTDQMYQAATFLLWNSCGEVVWTIDEGNDYPRLIWEGRPGVPIPSYELTDFLTGSGDPNDPYLVYTPQEMNTIGCFPCEWFKCFKLMADIDLAAYTGIEFNLIGVSPEKPFTGTFDGNNHTISNFTYTSTTTDYVGLFGALGSGGQIKNLGLTNVNVTGYDSTGGLVGYNSGTITNSYATGSVTGQYDTGGLVGYNSSGTITNSYATGSVTGQYYTGGLVGWSEYGTITNSYATGSVTGSDSTGGLVGWNGGTITNCYATGNVGGWEYTGGLVGGNWGTITNCYAAGSVTGQRDYTGGLVGENYGGTITNSYATGNVSGFEFTGGLVGYNSGTVSASFWDIETTGQSSSAGGVGKTTAQMKTKSTFTSAFWDFVNIWTICETTNYPRLLWQVSAADFVCPDGVNFIDYAYFANRWLEINCSNSGNCGGTDLDLSGTVDIADLALFAMHWLEEP